MSTSRITPRSSSGPRPGLAQRPARASRVVAQLESLGSRALDREEAQTVGALAPGPLSGHATDPDHPALPAESQRLDPPVQECRQNVHGLVERFEHGVVNWP